MQGKEKRLKVYRGDDQELTFQHNLVSADITEVKLYARNEPDGTLYVQLKYTVVPAQFTLTEGYMKVALLPANTSALGNKTYQYDLEVTHTDGDVTTIYFGEFVCIGDISTEIAGDTVPALQFYLSSDEHDAVDGANNPSASNVFATINDLVLSNITIDADKNWAGMGITNIDRVNVAQTADSIGIQVDGFDDQSGEYIKMYVGSSSWQQLVASGILYLEAESGVAQLKSADSHINLRLGDNAGAKLIQIKDSDETTVATIDSNGNATFVEVDTKKTIELVLTDDDTALATKDGLGDFKYFIPASLNGYNLTDAQACVNVASTSGTPTFQVYNLTDTVDMLSTAITIDANEKTSFTATTPSVVDGANDDVATGDEIRIDCDVAGTGTTGVVVILTFEKP